MRQKYIHVFDGETGQSTWFEMKVVNHDLKLLRRKEFVIDCGFCGNNAVLTYETHIQHGFMEDRFWEYVFCDKCQKISIHKYTVSEGDNNG